MMRLWDLSLTECKVIRFTFKVTGVFYTMLVNLKELQLLLLNTLDFSIVGEYHTTQIAHVS